MLRNKKLSSKVMVLGVDGMDPRLTRKYIDEGLLPNIKKIAERGAQRHDFVMLGAQPTVTPPQWTTLATGAYPSTHGITQFSRTIPGHINKKAYNVDSRLCKAEQAWNVTAEAGYKTCVFHWPGSAWPPSSENENLMVVDGSSPGSVGAAALFLDEEFIISASETTEATRYLSLEVEDAVAPCVVKKMPHEESSETENFGNAGAAMKDIMNGASSEIPDEVDTLTVLLDDADGFGTRQGDFVQKLNNSISPIKPAQGWIAAPEGAKEFEALVSNGLIRRVGLILKNPQGIYDTVTIYKNKKETMPIVTLKLGEMAYDVIDEVYFDDKKYIANRHYKLLELKEDGSELKIFVSTAMDTKDDSVFHPKRLQKALFENAGPFPPQAMVYTQDEVLQECNADVWHQVCRWYTKALHYMIENEGVEVIFSHLHSIDLAEHTFIRYMHNLGFNQHPESVYNDWMIRIYQQVDEYMGSMMHYIDEGWTLIITSDHAQVAPKYIPPAIGDMCGVNVGLMKELGYTVMIKDENGNDTRKIDWSKTRAIASQGNDIFINLKGREVHGIVEPEDKYELEEQIMTDLYNYKHPDTGKRCIALAIRNKDALVMGYGGPTAGDICFWTADGYSYDHTDSLSTALGEADTSSSPIFIAAGSGLKSGFETERVIRQVDLAPTVCTLLGVRMPAQCEGAPVYQILNEEF